MPKYVCTNLYDNFYTQNDETAMDHLHDNPDHQIVMVEEDYAGNISTKVISSREEED